MVETDIPSLEIAIPDKFFQQKVNLNDQIFVAVNYPKPTDDIFFSVSLYYDFNVVGNSRVFYKEFSVVLWNYPLL
jgi:hypothetical protein